ncbi:hypothetical protein I316_07164 [Kwoniella heveanensis BCC8398]|uniref:Uncharacterized protein n=1 Tax=Kwoniella heveanensis BCC8398 TaxID=1296120 RepID=A0A1B9GJN8_9TREE|nr:hypothetical protein I316_07164 [Kwoniella heveanensis BCC8398]
MNVDGQIPSGGSGTGGLPAMAFGHRVQPNEGLRFATTTNAFGLASPSTSASLSNASTSVSVSAGHSSAAPTSIFGTTAGGSGAGMGMKVDTSPPSAGTVTTRRLRRPSMLSLTQNASFSSNDSGKADDEATPLHEAPSSATLGGEMGTGIVQDPSSSKAPQLLHRARAPPPTSGLFTAATIQPSPRWPGRGGSFANSLIRRTSSAPSIPFEDLKTSTPPIPQAAQLEDDPEEDSIMDTEGDGDQGGGAKSPLKWAPSHLQSSTASRRKGKARMDDLDLSPPQTATTIHVAPFSGRPLPSALMQTIASEQAPLDHEMQSEARLQRFLLSHPQKLPLTPRAPKGSRGRFPDQVGGDDDDEDEFPIHLGAGRRTSSWTRRNWMDRARMDDSDSDSDDVLEDIGPGGVEPVNSAFAAGMDMDRPGSSSSSGMWMSANRSDSGKSTPGRTENPDGSTTSSGPSQQQQTQQRQQQQQQQSIINPFPTPPSGSSAVWPNAAPTSGPGSALRSTRLSFSSAGAGLVPSPGNFGLPSAFGTLGMGGIGTPVGSPTVERLELGASPGAGPGGVGSPGLMQYRESQGGQATVRPGKRKAQAEDRFDPYKRTRGSSPSLMNSSPFPISPSRTSSIPIPQSPSHAPLYPSALSTSLGRGHHGHPRAAHPYTRPMASRSRAASPALSIGSAGGLSSSFGNNGVGSGSMMARSFSLSGGGASASGEGKNNGNGNGNGTGFGLGGQQLGGLGLLSIQNSVSEEDEKEDTDEVEEMRMEED